MVWSTHWSCTLEGMTFASRKWNHTHIPQVFILTGFHVDFVAVISLIVRHLGEEWFGPDWPVQHASGSRDKPFTRGSGFGRGSGRGIGRGSGTIRSSCTDGPFRFWACLTTRLLVHIRSYLFGVTCTVVPIARVTCQTISGCKINTWCYCYFLLFIHIWICTRVAWIYFILAYLYFYIHLFTGKLTRYSRGTMITQRLVATNTNANDFIIFLNKITTFKDEIENKIIIEDIIFFSGELDLAKRRCRMTGSSEWII